MSYKYTVIIPCYNSEDFIERAMLSVVNQTYKNIELIVINDGSTDMSDSIVSNFINKYSSFRIKYKLIENSGPSTARNIGLEIATGDYVCFLDSDDEYAPELFEKIDTKIGNNDICFFEYIDFDESGNLLDRYSDMYPPFPDNTGIEVAKAKINNKLWICNCNAIYRKSLITDNNNYYPEGIYSGEDTCFIYSNLLCARKVTSIQYEGFKCYTRSDSLMHSPINNRFLTVVDAYKILIERITKYDHLSINEKEYFINMINSKIYFVNIVLAKKIAACTNFSNITEYFNQIKKYKISHFIKYSKVNIFFTKKEKVQIYLYNISKLLFYFFSKLYYKSINK